jgi:hypothetical protein
MSQMDSTYDFHVLPVAVLTQGATEWISVAANTRKVSVLIIFFENEKNAARQNGRCITKETASCKTNELRRNKSRITTKHSQHERC